MRQIPENFILPDFGGNTSQSVSHAVHSEGQANTGNSGPRKLVLVYSKGSLDMAYPGLILGNAAAGEGIETHIFFTFWGLDIINKMTHEHMKFSMLGNTAMRIPELGYLRPGLEHMSMPQVMPQSPGMTAVTTKTMKIRLPIWMSPPCRNSLTCCRWRAFIETMSGAGVPPRQIALKSVLNVRKWHGIAAFSPRLP